VDAPLHLRVAAEQVPAEGQRGGGGLVPRDQEDQHLVADLLGGRGRTGPRVAGSQQQRHQVPVAAWRAAAPVEDGVDGGVQRPPGAARPADRQRDHGGRAAPDLLTDHREGGEASGQRRVTGRVHAELDHQQRPVQVGAQHPGPLARHRAELRGGAGAVRQRPDLLDALLDPLLQQGQEQLGLAAELRVDRADGEAGLARDRVHRGAMVARRQEHLARGRQQRRPVGGGPVPP
jgi:hypothetical protein